MKITKGFSFISHHHNAKKIAEVVVEKTQEATSSVIEKVTETTTVSIEKIENTKSVGIFVSTGKRFFKINGLDLAGLLTLEFFTTLIPIIILGASGISGFNKRFNIGDAVITRLGLVGESARTVHSAFPSGADLKSFYTFFGLLSFLIWGIPMAIQVGRVFAASYDSSRFSLGSEITRGIIWFNLFLITLVLSNFLPENSSNLLHIVHFVVKFLAVYLFWIFTPALLVRDGIVGIKFLMTIGLAGAIVDSMILPIIMKTTIPLLLNSWEGFNSIGVAMTVATWCTITSITWVLVACFGGELVSRFTHNEKKPSQ